MRKLVQSLFRRVQMKLSSVERKVILPPVALIGIAGCLLLGFQNCANNSGFTSSASTGATPNASPFANNKVMIKSASNLVAANNNLPVGTLFTAVVSESCLKTRHSADLVAKNSGYFIDKYLPTSFYLSATAGSFDHYAFKVSLKTALPLSSISEAVAHDPCFVGLADYHTYNLGASGASGASSAASSLPFMQADQFVTADQAFQTQIPSNIKVTVAVIDTGIDLSNSDLSSALAPNSNLGVDLTQGLSQPGNSAQDLDGHGTAVASIIAAQGVKNPGVLGLASRNASILPIRVLLDSKSGTVDDPTLFMAIRRAVNGGAEVINLSLGGKGACSPIVGQAIFSGIQSGAFFAIAAGNSSSNLLAATEIGTLPETTTTPACWGQFFKGAVTVGALNTGAQTLASFSNWGAQSVEISAPGTGLSLLGLNNSTVVGENGTSFSSPQVAAAAALTIAFHKAQGYPYTPWLIEDVLMNGSSNSAALANSSTPVRLGRYLDFSALQNRFAALTKETAAQRLQEPTDDNDAGQGFNVTSINASTQLVGFDVFSNQTIISSQTPRVQFFAVAYYANGSYLDVTRQVNFTSSNNNAMTFDAQGIGYPVKGYQGAVVASSSFKGLAASTSVTLLNFNTQTGEDTSIANLSLVPAPENNPAKFNYDYDYDLIANYGNGAQVNVSQFGSYASSDGNLSFTPTTHVLLGLQNGYGGQSYTVTGFYHGQMTQTTFTSPVVPPPTCFSTQTTRGSDTSATNTCTSGTIATTTGVFSIVTQSHVYWLQNTKWTSQDCPDLSFDNFTVIVNSANLGGPRTCHFTVAATYRGTGTAQPFSMNYTLNIVADPIQSLSISGNLNFGTVTQGLNVTATTLSGKTVIPPASTLSWQFTKADGSPAAFSWMVPSSSNVNNGGYDTFIFDGVAAGPLTLKVSLKANPSITTSKALPIIKLPSCTVPTSLASFATPSGAPAVKTQISASCSAPGSAAAQPFAAGAGTSDNPYVICSFQQFLNISADSQNHHGSHFFQLGANIDMSVYSAATGVTNLLPNPGSVVGAHSFLDGQGYEISNVIMVNPSIDNVGLLSGYWDSVKNLTLANPIISGANTVGVLSGNSQIAVIDNVWVTGAQVSGAANTGGLVGETSSARIQNSGIVSSTLAPAGNGGNGTFGQIIGGLVGFNAGRTSIAGVYVNLTIQSVGVAGAMTDVGGLIGNDIGQATIVNAMAQGKILQAGFGVGGLVGVGRSCIYSSSSSIDITSQSDNVGGLMGLSTGYAGIFNSTFTGTLHGRNNVGGIIGEYSMMGYPLTQVNGNTVGAKGSPVSINCVANCGGVIGSLATYGEFSNNVAYTAEVGTPAGYFAGLVAELVSPAGIKVPDLISNNTSPTAGSLSGIGVGP